MSDNDEEKEALVIVFSDNDFSGEEITQISDAFSAIVPIQQRCHMTLSAKAMPAVLKFSLGAVVGNIAEGFFGAIGSDSYQKAKKIAIDSLKIKETPTLRFEMLYKDVKISMCVTTDDESILSKAFDTIGKAKDLAISELDKKETPQMTEISLGFDKDWKFADGANWRPMNRPRVVKFYQYNGETGKWELTRDWKEKPRFFT